MQILPVPVEQLVGQTLGPYQLEQLLGSGSINAVFLAYHPEQNRRVMLTAFLIPDSFSAQVRERFVARFTYEASALMKLKHPHVLPVYDFGVQLGYPYFVTPMATGNSLAKLLKEQGRCNPVQALNILKQAALGLDYAHSNGVMHGTLKPANILLDAQLTVQVSGLGMMRMLSQRGILPNNDPRAHLLSVAGSPIIAPGYTAPEVLQGSPVDSCADVYSLGVILFETLSGSLPFTGSSLSEMLRMQTEYPIPSLQRISPDIPPAIDLVVQRALEPDPTQRFQYAEKLATAFERVLTVIQEASTAPIVMKSPGAAPIAEATLLPTVNWFEEEAIATQQWDQQPTAISTKMPQLGHNPTGAFSKIVSPDGKEVGNWQLRPPIVTGQMGTIKMPNRAQPVPQPLPDSPGPQADSENVDPFLLWSTGVLSNNEKPHPGTFEKQQEAIQEEQPQKGKKKKKQSVAKESREKPQTPQQPKDVKQSKLPSKGRRRTIALLATGSAALLGLAAAGSYGVVSYLNSQNGTGNKAGNTNPTGATKNNLPSQQKQQQGQQTPQKQQQGGQQQQGQQTTQKQQPPQQKHTGTAVTTTNRVPANSSRPFTSPVNNAPALLIHLPSGTFVAYESVCTHEGGQIYYNANTNKMVCKKHGAIFDPANNATILQGPADVPQPMVPIHVYNDGTITAG